MIRKIREAQRHEEGFTLIELLVVVIIIGILAAIAIPSFLSQRERGWQAELTSHVRNAALEVEAEATSAGGEYPGTFAGEATFETAEVALTYTPIDANTDTVNEAFTLSGTHTRINGGVNCITYSSGTGGAQGGMGDFVETSC